MPSPLTPWGGKPTLGYKTRTKNKKSDKYIVRRRKKIVISLFGRRNNNGQIFKERTFVMNIY